jgi:hypothetical protein
VAIDKHTEQGKKIIKQIAEVTEYNAKTLSWTFFYFASVIENQISTSKWWHRENNWRLRKIGLNYATAEKIWVEVNPIFIKHLQKEEEELRDHIFCSIYKKSPPLQLNIFNEQENK